MAEASDIERSTAAARHVEVSMCELEEVEKVRGGSLGVGDGRRGWRKTETKAVRETWDAVANVDLERTDHMAWQPATPFATKMQGNMS